MEGVVIQSYGAGNAPSNRKDLMKAFKQATDSGIIIVNTTQCNRGVVFPTYGTGKASHNILDYFLLSTQFEYHK